MNYLARVSGRFWKHNVVGSKSRVHINENGVVTCCGRSIDDAGTHLHSTELSSLCVDCIRTLFMRHVMSGDIKL